MAALLIVLLAGGGWYAMKARGAAKPAEAAQGEGGPGKKEPKIDVYELSKADVATIDRRELRLDLPLAGALAPLDQATVKSKVSGVVLETTLQEGMNVAAGQVIARLDAADQRARVAQMQAAYDEANARLSLAKKNNANSQALLKQNYISQSSYDTTQNSVELAEASLAAARAQLDMARIALADTVIKAPLAGVISKRHVQAGEKLAPDMPVFTIVSLRQLNLEAQVPASEVPRVKIGQEVRFKVDGYQQRDFIGKVARISPTTEAGSRSMIVYISRRQQPTARCAAACSPRAPSPPRNRPVRLWFRWRLCARSRVKTSSTPSSTSRWWPSPSPSVCATKTRAWRK